MFSWNCHNHFEHVFAIHEAFCLLHIVSSEMIFWLSNKSTEGSLFLQLFIRFSRCVLSSSQTDISVGNVFSPVPLRLCSVGASILTMFCQLIGLIFILHSCICIFLWMLVEFFKSIFYMQTNFHDYVCAFLFSIFLSKMWCKNVVYFFF